MAEAAPPAATSAHKGHPRTVTCHPMNFSRRFRWSERYRNSVEHSYSYRQPTKPCESSKNRKGQKREPSSKLDTSTVSSKRISNEESESGGAVSDSGSTTSSLDSRDMHVAAQQLDSWKPSFIRVMNELSAAPYYYGRLSGKEAACILKTCPDDTFLVRDSEDDRSLFAITYRTGGAIGSTRVQYRNGLFSLNFNDDRLPQFTSVVDLMSHCMRKSVHHPVCMVYIRGQPHYVYLRRPLCMSSPASLQQICHLTIWKSYNRSQLETMYLPATIRQFLLSNPFRLAVDD